MNNMNVAEEIKTYLADEVSAQVSAKADKGEAKLVVAEQRSMLSKKKVEYSAKFKVDDKERAVRFFEMLKESGSGMTSGDVGAFGGGWGVSKTTYKMGGAGIEGNLEEQGALLGKKFAFTFDYGRIRNAVKAIAERNGYSFEYQVTPKGL
jgi:hypothetical protein